VKAAMARVRDWAHMLGLLAYTFHQCSLAQHKLIEQRQQFVLPLALDNPLYPDLRQSLKQLLTDVPRSLNSLPQSGVAKPGTGVGSSTLPGVSQKVSNSPCSLMTECNFAIKPIQAVASTLRDSGKHTMRVNSTTVADRQRQVIEKHNPVLTSKRGRRSAAKGTSTVGKHSTRH
jgi:hypothetical protein